LVTILLRYAQEVTHYVLEASHGRLVTLLHLEHEVVRKLVGWKSAPRLLYL
jgi:hypothetical protein